MEPYKCSKRDCARSKNHVGKSVSGPSRTYVCDAAGLIYERAMKQKDGIADTRQVFRTILIVHGRPNIIVSKQHFGGSAIEPSSTYDE